MKSLTGQQNSQALLGVAHLFYQHTFTVRKSYIVLDRTFNIIVSDGLDVKNRINTAGSTHGICHKWHLCKICLAR